MRFMLRVDARDASSEYAVLRAPGEVTAIGGPLSMVTSVAVVIAEGPLLPETSDTAFALTARSSVPSEHIFTVTEIFVPEDEDGV